MELGAALVRLKRMVMAVGQIKERASATAESWGPKLAPLMEKFDAAVSDDLNTPIALTAMEDAIAMKKVDPAEKLALVSAMDAVMGLGLLDLERTALRIRPKDASVSEDEIEATLSARKEARAAKDFAKSDALRDDLAAKGVEVMDGDSLGWEWKLG